MRQIKTTFLNGESPSLRIFKHLFRDSKQATHNHINLLVKINEISIKQ